MIENIVVMDEKESADIRYRLRDISRRPLVDVAADTLVKVRGYVLPEGTPVVAPITGSRCALYCVEWRELLPTSRESRFLPRPPRHQQAGGHDLIIDDGTAHALVRVNNARVSLLGVSMMSRPRDLEAGSRAGDWLRSRKTEHSDDPYIAYRETTVEWGAMLTVLGHATYEADPGPARSAADVGAPYRGSHRRCVMAESASSPLYIIREAIVSLEAIG